MRITTMRLVICAELMRTERPGEMLGCGGSSGSRVPGRTVTSRVSRRTIDPTHSRPCVPWLPVPGRPWKGLVWRAASREWPIV